MARCGVKDKVKSLVWYGMSCLDIWWKAGELLTGSFGRRSFCGTFCGKHTSFCGLSFPDFCTGYNVFTEQPALPALLRGANEEQAATNCRKIPIDLEQLKDYLASDFKNRGISVLMQISEPTLLNVESRAWFIKRESYSNISDNDLDIVIANVLKRFPKFGLQLLQGKLVANGYKLQEKRLQASYARIGLKKA
ncbi:hypothetical protein OUZ56_007580 [Daphnia magna]|uniref:Uncharacterized protein n=1 Tax=Daphnia magna TaxID=35525 RepID=A0ABR0AAT1_9CRUS|nr:hypothetical protein OUZ56_007580 [Daphnia magna]